MYILYFCGNIITSVHKINAHTINMSNIFQLCTNDKKKKKKENTYFILKNLNYVQNQLFYLQI